MKVDTRLPILRSDDVVVDNTLLGDVRSCSTKGAMRHVLGLTMPGEKAELECGSAVHEALARWIVTGGDAEAALKRFDRVYKPWAEEHVPKVDDKGKPARLAWKRVHSILDVWLKGHPFEKWGLVVDPRHVEIPVWAPLGYVDDRGKLWAENGGDYPDLTKPKWRKTETDVEDPIVVMVALLDAIGKKPKLPSLWSCDHKTTGWIGERYKDRQEDSSQFTGQLWAGAQRGLHLAGIFINGIELPNPHVSKKTCSKHGLPLVNCSKYHAQTLFHPITRTQNEIAAWEKSARKITRDFLRLKRDVRDLQDVAELPMEGRFVGACGYCPFRDFCRFGRQKHFAEKKFIHDPWRPLDYAGKRGGWRDKDAA